MQPVPTGRILIALGALQNGLRGLLAFARSARTRRCDVMGRRIAEQNVADVLLFLGGTSSHRLGEPVDPHPRGKRRDKVSASSFT